MGKNTIIKDALILFVITLFLGTALACVYEVTKEPIKMIRLEKKIKAYKDVFIEKEKTNKNENINDEENQNIKFKENEDIKLKLEQSEQYLLDNGIDGVIIDEILIAIINEEEVGYAMTVTTSKGYGGNITLVLGILRDGTVKGMEILTINETVGLGMKAKDKTFLAQFTGKNVNAFEYTKKGSTKDNEIDALSGATITTSAITEAVNAGILFVNNYLDGE